ERARSAEPLARHLACTRSPPMRPLRSSSEPLEQILEQDPHERPTIPVPMPAGSGVRITLHSPQLSWAVVDVVVCDLSRDPRSEDYFDAQDAHGEASEPQNERP